MMLSGDSGRQGTAESHREPARRLPQAGGLHHGGARDVPGRQQPGADAGGDGHQDRGPRQQ